MNLNLSLSWFLVLIAFVIMSWCAYRTPAGVGRMSFIAWALFFMSILCTGFITMHASGAHP